MEHSITPETFYTRSENPLAIQLHGGFVLPETKEIVFTRPESTAIYSGDRAKVKRRG